MVAMAVFCTKEHCSDHVTKKAAVPCDYIVINSLQPTYS